MFYDRTNLLATESPVDLVKVIKVLYSCFRRSVLHGTCSVFRLFNMRMYSKRDPHCVMIKVYRDRRMEST